MTATRAQQGTHMDGSADQDSDGGTTMPQSDSTCLGVAIARHQ